MRSKLSIAYFLYDKRENARKQEILREKRRTAYWLENVLAKSVKASRFMRILILAKKRKIRYNFYNTLFKEEINYGIN